MRVFFQILSIVLLFVPSAFNALSQDGTFYFDYSTYLGGGSDDLGWAVAVDTGGSAYICGRTESADFPTSSAYQPSGNVSSDVFITKLTTSGSDIIFSTYLGGGRGRLRLFYLGRFG